MTLSNFNQTDKQVQQWFLLLPDGHEGPYSLEQLEQKVKSGDISPDCKVWKEGGQDSYFIHEVMGGNLELPPMPVGDDLPPELPFESISEESVPVNIEMTPPRNWIPVIAGVSFLLLIFFVSRNFMLSSGPVEWSRPQKMDMNSYQSISQKLIYESADQPLFLYEATAADYSKIWLITAQFYTCDIEAQFTSVPDEVLSFDIKEVSFSSTGKIQKHVLELDKFRFEKGSKIIPGFYRMNLTAQNCMWEGMRARISNLTDSIPEKIELSYRIAIFPLGAAALTDSLQQLAKEKYQREQQKKLVADQFWQDVQQKYQTLLAVSLQMEQLFVDFLESNKSWKAEFPKMVEKYTKIYGALLTNFVISNEDDFKKLRAQQVQNISVKTAYESRIKTSATQMGHKAMEIIEAWQNSKPVSSISGRESLKKNVNKTFKSIKEDLNQKLIDVTEEQASLTEE